MRCYNKVIGTKAQSLVTWRIRLKLVKVVVNDNSVEQVSDFKSSSSSSLVFSPKAGFGRNQSPVRRPVWLWHTAF